MAAATLSLFALAGCHNDMWIQPKYKPQDQSDVFPDQMNSRPLVAHTLDRDHFWTDSERYTGYGNDNKIADTFPFKVTQQDMQRGKNRFEIFCTPCHGALGNGQGMIAMRGFSLRRQPGNYHTEQLRNAPVGHFYDVITNGYGTMYSYASRIEPDDRWRIVAYIRALQRSQNAQLGDVDTAHLTPNERRQIETAPPPQPVLPNGAVPTNTGVPNPTGTSGTPLPESQPAPLADTPVPNVPMRSGVPANVTSPSGSVPTMTTPNGTTPTLAPGQPSVPAPPSGTAPSPKTPNAQPANAPAQGGTSGASRSMNTSGNPTPAGGANGNLR